MVRILFADNHTIVRDAIRRVLGDDAGIQLVGEACNFSEAVIEARKIRPDVLVLDIDMLFETDSSLPELRDRLHSSGAAVLGISLANDDDARSIAKQMGAAELLDKMEVGKALIPAILRVASERSCLPPSVIAEPSHRSDPNELERPVQGCIGRN